MEYSIEKLIKKIRRGEVILWAGAGFSRYTGIPTGAELAQEIINEMPEDYRERFEKRTLPEIAEEFVQMNGNLKNELFRLLDKYVNVEPKDLSVHEKLTEIIQIKNIITTNYDDLFERSYGRNKTSIIYKNTHLALANKNIKIFKIHGDIQDPTSIVLTNTDYRKFYNFENDNELVWSKIKTLANEKSILFIGYSLEDSNALTLLDDMIKNLGDFRHESFLVAPNFPDYKQRVLNEKNITYINMTTEEIIEEVHKAILNEILDDTEAGFLNIKEVKPLLEKKGLNAQFGFSDDGNILLKGLGAKDKEKRLSLKLNTIANDKIPLRKFLENDVDIEEVELPEDIITGFSSEFEGINLPTFSKDRLGSIKLIRNPDREFDACFVIKETGDILNEIKGQVFQGTNGLKIRIKHSVITFEVRIQDDVQTFNITFKYSSDMYKGYQAISFLKKWLKNDYTLMLNNLTDKVVIPLTNPNEARDWNEKFLVDVSELENFYANIIQIQNHFSVYLQLPETINELDYENFDAALDVVNNRKRKINKYSFLFNLNSKEELNTFVEMKEFPFKATSQDLSEITLFGENITLGYLSIETLDGYVANKEELLEKYNQSEEKLPIVIKSLSNEMYYSYESKKEVLQPMARLEMDQKELRCAILKEVSIGNTSLSENDFGVSENDFNEAVNFLTRENYLIGVQWADDRPHLHKVGPTLTENGEKYLEENNCIDKSNEY
ncbi:YjcQ family protein [Neobacillus sp. BF23-41]|uniref:YjcQ family protein n=1 Tax=Neobacillus sp. BF23-41 TaxID=3240280 RepID=UPI0034E42779